MRWPNLRARISKESLLLGLLLVGVLGETSLGDDAGFQSASESLAKINSEQGHAASFTDFVNVLNSPDLQVTQQEFFELWNLLEKQQSPPISKEKLRQLISAKQQSIKNFFVEVESTGFYTQDQKVVHSHKRFELAGDGEKLLSTQFDVTDLGEHVKYIYAFDGKLVRRYYHRKGHFARLYSSEFDNRWELASPIANPLWMSMLLESKKRLGYVHGDVDLAGVLAPEFSSIVFEEPVDVNGRSCVVVSGITSVVYLDPEMDYSVVQREGWDHEASNRLSQRDHFVVFLDHKQLDNRIWCPMKYLLVNKTGTSRSTFKVKLIKVNEGVSESLFDKGIVPDGTKTHDEFRDLFFDYSEEADKEAVTALEQSQEPADSNQPTSN